MADEAAPQSQLALEIGSKCPDWGCGLNSPLMDNGFFHELNLDGLRNVDGYALTTVRKEGLGSYDLSVENGRMSARLRTNSPIAPLLTGGGLVGLEISLNRINPDTGATTYWTMKVAAVSGGVEYRADRLDGVTPPTIESYRFRMQAGPFEMPLCAHGPEVLPPSGPRPIMKGFAVVYAGERINAEYKSISAFPNFRWFNIGCAETAVAKLQLYGHTQTAVAAGFPTTFAERQTLLKMLVGDYCGHGKTFTVAGQPLDWEDDHGTMVLPASTASLRRTEARWTPNGAACLNTPRVIARPSDEAIDEFADGVAADLSDRVEAAIRATCPRPPTCPTDGGSYHLESYNRRLPTI